MTSPFWVSTEISELLMSGSASNADFTFVVKTLSSTTVPAFAPALEAAPPVSEAPEEVLDAPLESDDPDVPAESELPEDPNESLLPDEPELCVELSDASAPATVDPDIPAPEASEDLAADAVVVSVPDMLEPEDAWLASGE
jgi:hypothetical protein